MGPRMRYGHTIAIALVSLAFGCRDETERLPRDASWEPIFFESIDERARTCGLTPLRQAVLPERSSEIRIWAGFGLQGYPVGGHPVEGIVLKRVGDLFSGTHHPRAPSTTGVIPASGWTVFWRRLDSAGVFDLPDSSELKGYKPILDGICYVVETRRNGGYRTYMYGNPALQEVPEAKQFLRLLGLLRRETGFDSAQ